MSESLRPHRRLNPDFDIGAFDLHGKRRKLYGAIADFFAGANVIFPHVPGATDDFALEHPFAQRSALMEAGVVGGVELSIDVIEGDFTAICDDAHRRPGLQIRSACNFDESRHSILLVEWTLPCNHRLAIAQN